MGLALYLTQLTILVQLRLVKLHGMQNGLSQAL